MAYKGNDLDLRPSRPSVAAREVPGPAERTANTGAPSPTPGAGPIPVDDAVLACCNCAYDVARFHGCEDVRLEHLLHALTRVGAAAEALIELGIRPDILRRETAVAIAAEMPAGAIGDHPPPRASAAFEDVLRRAADLAARRRAPAGLHDLLRTMLGGGPGSPAAAMLMRAAADPQQLERWRDAPLRAVLNAGAPEVASQPGEMAPAAAAALLARLDHMEAAMRALHAEVAADRQAVADLLRDVQSGLQAMRGEGARMPAADRQMMADLLRELQSGLQALRSEGARAATIERTPGIDALLEAKLGDLGKAMGALSERVAGIDKVAPGTTWQELRGLLETVEGRLGAHTLEVANRIADAFSKRLDKSEAGLQRLQEEAAGHWSASHERQSTLEAAVKAQLQGAEEAGKTHERDLGEIYQALVKLGANQQTLGDNFTAWRIESGGDIGIISNRLQQLEQTMLDLLGHLGNELQALRHDSHDGGGARRNGFKRWLYGTGNVFAAGWRDELPSGGHAPTPTPKEDAADTKVEIVEKKS